MRRRRFSVTLARIRIAPRTPAVAGEYRNGLRFFSVGQTAFAIFAAAAVIAAQTVDISQQASRAMREGRFEEANAFYRQLVQKYPKNAGWHGNLGLALHSQNPLPRCCRSTRAKRAIATLGRAVRCPWHRYLKLNERAMPLRRWNGPIESMRWRMPTTPAGVIRKPLVLLQAAQTPARRRAWWQARDYAQALPLYETLAPQAGDEPDSLGNMAIHCCARKDREAAIPWLERSAVLPQGARALGKAYAEAGRFAEAIPHLEAQ
jgi:tetratricopeptide (TPR) repeat protein